MRKKKKKKSEQLGGGGDGTAGGILQVKSQGTTTKLREGKIGQDFSVAGPICVHLNHQRTRVVGRQGELLRWRVELSRKAAGPPP